MLANSVLSGTIASIAGYCICDFQRKEHSSSLPQAVLPAQDVPSWAGVRPEEVISATEFRKAELSADRFAAQFKAKMEDAETAQTPTSRDALLLQALHLWNEIPILCSYRLLFRESDLLDTALI